MEANLKSIIDSLCRQIGETGLIIETRALQFLNKNQISYFECERILELLNIKDIYLNNEMKKLKLVSILLYLQGGTNPDKASVFLAKYDQLQSTKLNMRSSNNLDHLHLIYNMIECEYRYRFLSQDKIKLIGVQLSTYEKFEKGFEDFVLFKYYDGVIKYLLGDYQSAKVSVMDIVIDLSDEVTEHKTALVEFIELKNSILTLKILEKENCSKEIISHLESLYEVYNKKDEALSIKFAIKMCDIYISNYEYDKVFILLNNIFRKIKAQMYSSSNKFPDFIEVTLNTFSRFIFCAIMLGKSEEAKKFGKKIEKLLNYLKEYETKCVIEKETKENILAKYGFISLISKYIFLNKPNAICKSDLHCCISEYRTKFKNTILTEDDVIINIYSLNSSDLLAKNFFDKIALNMSIIQSNKFVSVKYLSLFFSIYNQIAILTKNVTTDTNIKKQFEYVEKIRSCSKAVIEYVQKYSDFLEIKTVFSFCYFKQVLIKVLYAYIFSFFFVREYKKVLDLYDDLQVISDKFQLNKGPMLKYYVDIYKIRADTLFKLEDYAEASKEYSKVLNIHGEHDNQTAYAVTALNLSFSLCYIKQFESSKLNLLVSLNKFELLSAANQNKYSDKINFINNLLQHLNSTLFSSIN